MREVRRLVRWMIFLFIGAALLTPRVVLASGEGELYQVEVEGYLISLEFTAEIKTGENEVHLEILDPSGQAVLPGEVRVSASRVEEAAHGESGTHGTNDVEPAGGHGSMTSSHVEATPANDGAMTGHEGMVGMTTEDSHEIEADAHEEAGVFILRHEMESGRHEGSLHFDRSGKWMLSVQFSTGTETLTAELPVIVTGTTSRYTVLGGIFGLNLFIIGAAAVLKPGAAKRKP